MKSAYDGDMNMEEQNLYWLAGLLEGEGSFLKGSPSRPHEPAVVLNMTDEDVVARVAAMFDQKYYKRRGRPDLGWKPSYIFRLRGSRAVDLMRILLPLMGHRRQEQIQAALACYVFLMPKLTRQQALEIRSRSKSGESAKKLAAEFGVSHWYVYDIKNGRSYTRVLPIE